MISRIRWENQSKAVLREPKPGFLDILFPKRMQFAFAGALKGRRCFSNLAPLHDEASERCKPILFATARYGRNAETELFEKTAASFSSMPESQRKQAIREAIMKVRNSTGGISKNAKIDTINAIVSLADESEKAKLLIECFGLKLTDRVESYTVIDKVDYGEGCVTEVERTVVNDLTESDVEFRQLAESQIMAVQNPDMRMMVIANAMKYLRIHSQERRKMLLMDTLPQVKLNSARVLGLSQILHPGFEGMRDYSSEFIEMIFTGMSKISVADSRLELVGLAATDMFFAGTIGNRRVTRQEQKMIAFRKTMLRRLEMYMDSDLANAKDENAKANGVVGLINGWVSDPYKRQIAGKYIPKLSHEKALEAWGNVFSPYYEPEIWRYDDIMIPIEARGRHAIETLKIHYEGNDTVLLNMQKKALTVQKFLPRGSKLRDEFGDAAIRSKFGSIQRKFMFGF